MLTIVNSALRMNEGEIVKISKKEGISVTCTINNTDETFRCNFLRTSSASAPQLKKGDKVIITLPSQPTAKGCILGVIEPYSPKNKLDKKLFSPQYPVGNSSVLDITDEIIKISASKGIILECGKGSIKITKDGRLSINGTSIATRSKGVNKIKGATVKIN